jgi:hypothetical protein
MSTQQESQAVATALAHIQAWSNHDLAAARQGLAPDVRVTATTTQPMPPRTDLSGVEDYMTGLAQFTQAVVPGSMRVIASTGDERNALITLSVEVNFGAGQATLYGSRLYLLDDNQKIQTEHVVFYVG